MKPSSPGLLCDGNFLITASISLANIGLSASSCLSFGGLCFQKFVYFAQVLKFLGIQLFIVITYDPLCFCGISCISPPSFLIVFLWVFSVFFLMNLLKDFSILFIFSKNQLLDLLILTILFLVSMLFNSALILIVSFLVLALGFVCCCSSNSCRCRVRLFI